MTAGPADPWREAREHCARRDFRALLAWVSRRDTPAPVQFAKYAAAGAVATAAHLAVVYLLSYFVLPAIDPALGDAVRSRRAILNNTAAFFVSNTVAYLTNVRWVFTPGRHRRWKEISLFFGVSGASYLLGTLAMDLLIRGLGLSSHLAFFSYIVTSVLVNFICRKFIVFKQ